MLFLNLSHKSSGIKRRKRWFSLPPWCISSSSSLPPLPPARCSLPVCRRSKRDAARSVLPLDDPLRYIWCQREQLVFLCCPCFPLILFLVFVLESEVPGCYWMQLWETVVPDWWPPGSMSGTSRLEKRHRRASLCPHPSSVTPNHARDRGATGCKRRQDGVADVWKRQNKNIMLFTRAPFLPELNVSRGVCAAKIIGLIITSHNVKSSSHRTNIISGREVISLTSFVFVLHLSYILSRRSCYSQSDAK